MMNLKKENKDLGRLKKRPDFLRVQQKGQKWVSKAFILQAAPQENQSPDSVDTQTMRFGLTVSKRAHKSAVKRNRIKRRLRALAKSTLPLYAQPGYDYVFIGREQALAYPYDSLKRDMLWCLKNLSCLKEKTQKQDQE